MAYSLVFDTPLAGFFFFFFCPSFKTQLKFVNFHAYIELFGTLLYYWGARIYMALDLGFAFFGCLV